MKCMGDSFRDMGRDGGPRRIDGGDEVSGAVYRILIRVLW